jgi:hypothetical protein
MVVINKRVFPMRIDELPVIGGFIRNSFLRDATSFIPYIDFAAPFPANYLTQLGLVQAAVSPEVWIAQMKLVTFNLITGTFTLRDSVNSAEIFFNSAGAGLNVMPKDMGQHNVRLQTNRGDVEALIGALRTMNVNIFNNSAVLITKGFTLIMQNALVTATAALNTANDLQNTLLEQRNSATSTNMTLYNSFWTTYVNPTAGTGKLIFKVSDKTKAKNYTVSQLIKRGRADELQTDVHGVVMNAGREVQNKAKVKFIPVDGGRTRTVYTNDLGEYVGKGMRATDYNMVVTKGALVKVVAVTVVTRVKLEVDVVVG